MQHPYEAENFWEAVFTATRFLWKDWPANMEAVGLDNQNNYNLRGTCPYEDCRRETVFVRVGNSFSEGLRTNLVRVVSIMQCQACFKIILGMAIHSSMSFDYQYETHYPLGTPDQSVPNEVPEAIARDFKEALRCLWVDAYNATAEMCRRAMEATCIDLGAPKKKVLEDMIDWLADQRKITPFLQQVAHKIRLGGNRAAHPEGEQAVNGAEGEPIVVIEKEHAEAMIKFAKEFFHHVYVVPKQLDKYDFSKPKQAKATQS